MENVAKQYILHEDIFDLMSAREMVQWKTMPLSNGSSNDLWAALSVIKTASWMSIMTLILGSIWQLWSPRASLYLMMMLLASSVSLQKGLLYCFALGISSYSTHTLSIAFHRVTQPKTSSVHHSTWKQMLWGATTIVRPSQSSSNTGQIIAQNEHVQLLIESIISTCRFYFVFIVLI